MNYTADQMDALSEMVNIGMGQEAGMLNDMVGSHVSQRAPVIDLLSPAALERKRERDAESRPFGGAVGVQGAVGRQCVVGFPDRERRQTRGAPD
ncbi:MAG: hypothetical protein GQ526_00550 [Ardenticatenales bacterium]|nr:hypothetical protein [Ardenticatenales bacterium]